MITRPFSQIADSNICSNLLLFTKSTWFHSASRKRAYQNFKSTSMRCGVIGPELTTEVAWSSIGCAGCSCSPTFPDIFPLIRVSISLCLKKLNVVTPNDYSSIVLHLFWRYIQVMRYLQSTYWLEPAGSHGVWGLDDYHFLPFFWGSGQLRGHRFIKPRAIHDPEVVEEYEKDYMYFACVAFINSVRGHASVFLNRFS